MIQEQILNSNYLFPSYCKSIAFFLVFITCIVCNFIIIYLGIQFDLALDFTFFDNILNSIISGEDDCPSNPNMAIDYQTQMEYRNLLFL